MIKIQNCNIVTGFLILSNGKIFDIQKNKFVKQSNMGGYKAVTLNNGKVSKRLQVHRLVAEHFLINECNCNIVNHIDGNKNNNDISNLEWVTHSENIKHAHNNGLIKSKIARKISPNDVIYIYNSDKTLNELKNQFSVSLQVIRDIKNLKLKYYKRCIEGA